MSEQQVDCFAGVYLRWVAEGESPCFALNTTDGWTGSGQPSPSGDRPPDFNPFGLLSVEALPRQLPPDRVSAVQQGFDLARPAVPGSTMADVRERRGDIPAALFDPGESGSDMPIDEPVGAIG